MSKLFFFCLSIKLADNNCVMTCLMMSECLFTVINYLVLCYFDNTEFSNLVFFESFSMSED